MDVKKKKNRRQTSAFHAAEVMSRDLSLLRGKKFPNYFYNFGTFSYNYIGI